jgi:hypothetical protein
MWFAPIISSAQANCSRFFFLGSRTLITGVPSGLNSVGPDDPLLFLIQTTPLLYKKGVRHDEGMFTGRDQQRQPRRINAFQIPVGSGSYSTIPPDNPERILYLRAG